MTSERTNDGANEAMLHLTRKSSQPDADERLSFRNRNKCFQRDVLRRGSQPALDAGLVHGVPKHMQRRFPLSVCSKLEAKNRSRW